jgi:hypothetical protein
MWYIIGTALCWGFGLMWLFGMVPKVVKETADELNNVAAAAMGLFFSYFGFLLLSAGMYFNLKRMENDAKILPGSFDFSGWVQTTSDLRQVGMPKTAQVFEDYATGIDSYYGTLSTVFWSVTGLSIVVFLILLSKIGNRDL